MKLHLRRSTVLVLLALLLASLPILVGCGGGSEEKEVTKIKLGGLIDLTGPTADTARYTQEAREDIIRWINEQGGIGGAKIEYIWRNTGYQVPAAVAGYETLSDAGVVAILVHSAAEGEALKAKAAADEIMLMSLSASLKLIDPPEWAFVDKPTYRDQFGAFVDWLMANWKESRAPRVAVLTIPGTLEQDFASDQVKKYASSKGLDLVGVVTHSSTALDYTPQLIRLRDMNVDYVYSAFKTEVLATQMKDAKRNGLAGKWKWASFMGASPYIVDLAGDLSEGLVAFYPFALWDTDVPGMALKNQLVSKYHKWNPATPNNSYLYGMIPTLITIEAIKKAYAAEGHPITGAKVRRALESMSGDYNTLGLTGPIVFSSTERRGNMYLLPVQVRNGKMVVAGDWIRSPDLSR